MIAARCRCDPRVEDVCYADPELDYLLLTIHAAVYKYDYLPYLQRTAYSGGYCALGINRRSQP